MIPKKIHYCWFGEKPLNQLAITCLNSWKKYFPEFEIIEWNEKNFDVNCCQYVKEAYEREKWAFVSDYARLKILYEHGGIYFDTDVEVIKSFDKIIEKGSFMGCENKISSLNPDINLAVNPGLGLAAPAGLAFIKELLDEYNKSTFLKDDGTFDLTTIVERTTKLLRKHGLSNTNSIQTVSEINIYPAEYFCPIDMRTGEICITDNTHSIHRFAGSWESKGNKVRGKVYRFINRHFGETIADFARKMLGRKK